MSFSLCIIQLYVAVFFGSEAREKYQWFKNHLPQEKQAAITVPVSAENSVRYYGVRGCPRDSVVHSSRTPRRPW